MLKSVLGLAAAAALAAAVFAAPVAMADSDHSTNATHAGDCTTFWFFDKKLHKCVDARNK